MGVAPEFSAEGPKKINKEYYYPTQVYFTDLATAEKINAAVKYSIYAWRERDPVGVVRTNSPQTGAWHSPTDMHVSKD